MKTNIHILFATLAIACSPVVAAEPAEKHSHEKQEAGPNGGRVVITSVEPHYEFYVTPERRTGKITFLGDDGKAIAPAGQTVTAIGGERAKPTRFAFAKDGDSLVSDTAVLPEGKLIPLVLQVKVSPDAKTVTEKIAVNLADCPTCEHKEYACTCSHGHDH